MRSGHLRPARPAGPARQFAALVAIASGLVLMLYAWPFASIGYSWFVLMGIGNLLPLAGLALWRTRRTVFAVIAAWVMGWSPLAFLALYFWL